MESFSVKEHYSEAIVNLWKQYDHLPELNVLGCEYRKSPLAPATIKKNTLLFIGINPSFTEGNTIPVDKKAIDFYNLDTQSDNQIPYFFSGMLSEQRALDLGSLERLMWGVKRILTIK